MTHLYDFARRPSYVAFLAVLLFIGACATHQRETPEPNSNRQESAARREQDELRRHMEEQKRAQAEVGRQMEEQKRMQEEAAARAEQRMEEVQRLTEQMATQERREEEARRQALMQEESRAQAQATEEPRRHPGARFPDPAGPKEPAGPSRPVRPEPTTSSPKPPLNVDAFLASLKASTIALSAPRQMKVEEEEVTVVLWLDPSKPTKADLTQQLHVEVRKDGQTVDTKIVAAENVQFSRIMRATLIGGDAFTVRPAPEQIQLVGENGRTEWKWQVTAKETGIHSLQARLEAVVREDGQDRSRFIGTWDTKVTVRITPPYFAKKYWQFEATAIVLPFVGWGYNKFGKKKRSAGTLERRSIDTAPREYTLRPTGWVRVVSGIQSLPSV